jgi:hypothetical protein
VCAAGDHCGVDVFSGGQSGVDHSDGGQQVRDQQRVDDEPRAVLGEDDGLPEPVSRELLYTLNGLIRCQQLRNTLRWLRPQWFPRSGM